MKVKIYPYKMGSKSATALARSIGCHKVFPNGGYKPRASHLIVNWGSTLVPSWYQKACDSGAGYLNRPSKVRLASDKLSAFEMMEDNVSIPEFTTRRHEATQWILDGNDVVARHQLHGHSGQGVEVLLHSHYRDDDEDMEPIPSAPLYVKYIKKSKEFRVHVFDGRVIDVQQKRKREGVEVDYKVRSYSNGWVFCRDDIEYDESVAEEAVKAVAAIGLDFGAVDVIWNDYYHKAYVLEVNTAPGLEGATVDSYNQAISNYILENY